MTREFNDAFNLGPREPAVDELEQNKRVADRKVLLDHVDWIFRPPLWVYEDMESAIASANRGLPDSEIICGDGYTRRASELTERCGLEDLSRGLCPAARARGLPRLRVLVAPRSPIYSGDRI